LLPALFLFDFEDRQADLLAQVGIPFRPVPVGLELAGAMAGFISKSLLPSSYMRRTSAIRMSK